MAIMIKGMEIPETCCDCNFNIAGWCVADLASERIEFPGRPDWCPLVEVQEDDMR